MSGRSTKQLRGGSMAVLSVLEHAAPESDDGWTVQEIAKVVERAQQTVRNQLVKLRAYTQVDSESAGAVGVALRGGVQTRVPMRTLLWSITKRGSGRLKWRGGHKDHCPIC